MKDTPNVSLYEAMMLARVELTNHSSDLYVPVNSVTTEILSQYETHLKNATTFKSSVEGNLWYDIPFAYDPEWKSYKWTPKGLTPKVGDAIRLDGIPFSLSWGTLFAQVKPGDIGIISKIDGEQQAWVLWGGCRPPYGDYDKSEFVVGKGTHIGFSAQLQDLTELQGYSTTFWKWDKDQKQVNYGKEVILWGWSGVQIPIPPKSTEPVEVSRHERFGFAELDVAKLQSTLSPYGFEVSYNAQNGWRFQHEQYIIRASQHGWISEYLDTPSQLFHSRVVHAGYKDGLQQAIDRHLEYGRQYKITTTESRKG